MLQAEFFATSWTGDDGISFTILTLSTLNVLFVDWCDLGCTVLSFLVVNFWADCVAMLAAESLAAVATFEGVVL